MATVYVRELLCLRERETDRQTDRGRERERERGEEGADRLGGEREVDAVSRLPF